MEEEIDLRRYIEVLIRYWYWIVGLGMAAAVIAFVVSSFLTPIYEASALVAVTGPRYRLQFDPRILDVPFDPGQFTRVYPTMATSDGVLLSVAGEIDQSQFVDVMDLQYLKNMLNAESADGGALVILKAGSRDPQAAARLANVWADQFVAQLNTLYGGDEDISRMEARLAEAKTALEQADQALTAFRREYGLEFFGGGELGPTDQASEMLGIAARQSRTVSVARELEAKARQLLEYETRADQIAQLLQEARAVQAQVNGATSPAVVAGLLADMLRLGVAEGQPSSLVQISLAGLDAESSLAALVTALGAKQGSTQETITRLALEVETLQSEVADRQQELEQLLRDRELAEDTHLTLSRKLQETSIEMGDDVARVLSHASVPSVPVSPRRRLNTAIAGVLGVMVAVMAVFIVEYWRQDPPAAGPAGTPPND